MHQPISDTLERGTGDRLSRAAAWLACEFAEWPWFVRVETEADRILVLVSVPVHAPGDLFARVDGFNVFRRQAPCS